MPTYLNKKLVKITLIYIPTTYPYYVTMLKCNVTANKDTAQLIQNLWKNWLTDEFVEVSVIYCTTKFVKRLRLWDSVVLVFTLKAVHHVFNSHTDKNVNTYDVHLSEKCTFDWFRG